jgi:class 3 adenylate cyclase
MCFFDISGYTRLTQEHGDRAAADFAERMRRLVERPAVAHGGRAVKWLGDGVMFYFATPTSAVAYYGHTVNVAARIGDFARPGEILVSQQVVDLIDSDSIALTAIGPVELKGLGEGLSLYVAEPPSSTVPLAGSHSRGNAK